MTYYTFSNNTRTIIHGMRKINGTAVKKKIKVLRGLVPQVNTMTVSSDTLFDALTIDKQIYIKI